jgi:tetratricopeptide (TPR) repeat protein
MGAMAASIAAMPATARRAADAYARGALPEARRICEAILGQSPDDVAALNILSLVEYRSGNATSALALVERAIGLSARNAHLHAAKGAILRAMGRPADAVHAYDRALGIAPAEASILSNRGNALAELGRLDAALADHDAAIRGGGDDPGRLVNRAMVLQSLRRLGDALADVDRAIGAAPRHAGAHDLRGTILRDLGRDAEALEAHGLSASLAPAHPAAFYHRANLLRDHGKPEAAIADFAKAIRLDPSHAPSLVNLANLLGDLGRHAEADALHDRLAGIPGQEAPAAWNKSLSMLRRGDFARGWPLYESRWQAPGFASFQLSTTKPRWDMSRRSDTVLAWGEQGVGDEIMFASMLPDLAAACGRVVVATDRRLVPLVGRSFPGLRAIPREEAAAAEYDSHVPFGSLGQFFRAGAGSFPATPFLACDAARAASLRSGLARPGQPLVGVSWASIRVPEKSFAARRLAEVPALRRARLASLQYGDCAAAVAELRGAGLDALEAPGLDATNDFDGLASLVMACDAVVTISNVTAHLAGGLGVPVFLLLPFSADWRWGSRAATSHWYRSVRIIRQARPGDWDGAFATLDAALCSAFPALGQGAPSTRLQHPEPA